MKKIIDIYHGDSISKYDTVVGATEFIVHKATQGTSFVDVKAIQRCNAFEERKHPYWLYTFLNKGNELEQTKFMVSKFGNFVKDKKYFIGWVLDVEQNNTAANIQKAYDYLLDYCIKHGHKMMLYIMYSQAPTHKNLIDHINKDYVAIWEARYTNKYQPHTYCDLWQYTESGQCDGIVNSGGCDVNRLTGKRDLKWFVTKPQKADITVSKPQANNDKPKELKTYTGTLRNPKEVYIKGYSMIGDNGNFVSEIQKYLNWYFGKEVLLVDSKFGANTEMYVEKFQRENDLKDDGKWGYLTYSKALTVKR